MLDQPILRRRWVWIVAALVLGLLGYRVLHRSGGDSASSTGAGAGGARVSVPVLVSQAKLGDLNRYLTALGTVTAFNTATVRTRVDGQIMQVYFTEGQFVHKDDLLLLIDPRPYEVQLKQAEGQLAKDNATLKDAELDLARDQDLFRQNVIAKQQLDLQVSTADQSKGAVVADEANVDSAKLQLTYCHIIAPFNGRIGLRIVDPGNIVHATDATGLAVITQVEPIAVLFNIAEDDLPRVLSDVRAQGSLPVEAYDRGLTTKLADGTLLTADNQIDTTTGTIRLKASFPNTDHSLFPNQFVNVKLLVDTLHNAVLVPTASVQNSQTGSFVYVVKSDKTVDARKIAEAGAEGDQTAIQSGVRPGELVVVEGLDRLQPGTHVTVASANMKNAQ